MATPAALKPALSGVEHSSSIHMERCGVEGSSLRPWQMIAHRNARGEVVELMQVKEGDARSGQSAGWMARTTLYGAVFTCTLPYLLRPATVAFCGNSWILDRVCGLICGAWDTFCEVCADLGIRAGRDSVGPERNMNSSVRNVDTSSHHFRTAST